MRQWILAAFFVAVFIAAGPRCRAAGLVVVTIDHMSFADVEDTARGPFTRSELAGSVVALISPGLPRGIDPEANLYSTLTAGDVADTSNEHAGLLQRQLFAAGADQDVTMIRFGDASKGVNRARLRGLIEGIESSTEGKVVPGLMLVGVTPAVEDGKKWDSLTPFAWLTCGPGAGSDASLRPTLISDTTQTPGLIALRDIAPMILAAEDAPIPDSMSGHPAHVYELGAASRQSRDGMLRRMDDLTRVNQRSLAPFTWTYGVFSVLTLFASIWAILKRQRTIASPLRFCIRIVVAVPLAMLLAPLLDVSSVPVYIAEIAALAVVLALIPRIAWLLVLAVVAIVADALAGTPLVSRSMLSAYWLSGIRFYGIGNEYMGLLIGMALTAPLLSVPVNKIAIDDTPPEPYSAISGARLSGLLIWYALVLFVLAYPQFGAKAGGAVTAMAAFLLCLLAIRIRRTPTLWMFLAAVAAGFATVFAFSWLAHILGGRATHIQAATSALAHGKLGYIEQIAVRKAKMAVKIALMPATFAAILGMVPVAIIWQRSNLRKRVDEYLIGRDDYRRALIAGLWGMLAALLFNDSGAVAALLLFGTLALPLMHELVGELCESSPSMSAMSGSELRSATSLSSEPTLS